MSDMMLFSGNATPDLAKSIANYLNISIADATIQRFSDGEIDIEINENVRGQDV
ncbi:MAG: ribose-phosphate pyrophosphokinase-like domain-containing protein, partial [Gammaproteobacteria bacterium]|nr:ribose-phosphate pyrophosphokinase-like domain-containing protein [Gammaproteobacteria bacterium]